MTESSKPMSKPEAVTMTPEQFLRTEWAKPLFPNGYDPRVLYQKHPELELGQAIQCEFAEAYAQHVTASRDAELRELRAEVTVVKHENTILRDDVRELRERLQRRTFKGTERPERCPDCDSRCWISSGPDELTCYHCYLAELGDKAEARAERAEASIRLGAREELNLREAAAKLSALVARLGKETK